MGIANITTGVAESDGVVTITPITFSLTDGNYKTLDIYASVGAQGARGPAGPTGPTGPQGESGIPEKIIVTSSGDIPAILLPNKYYKFTGTDISSLTVTLGAETEGVLNEYLFEFTVNTEGTTTLTLPESVVWLGDFPPALSAGKTYQVSIVDNLAIFGEW